MDDDAQLLLFRLDDRRYSLPLHQTERVERAVDCTPLPNAPSIVVGVIDVRGEVVPVLNIRERFGITGRVIGVDDHFILAKALGRRVALVVDKVDGVISRPGNGQGVVTGDVILPGLEHVQGVMSLEEGLTLIYDLDQFLTSEEGQLLDTALARQGEHGR